MKQSEQWPRYKYRLVAETLMKEYLPERVVRDEAGYWLNRGIDMQPIAEEAFEKAKGVIIDPVGFVWESDRKLLGCSPDGFISGSNDKEAIEIKSPAPWTQIEYLLAEDGEEPWQRYRCQVQGQIIVAQLEAVHFWAFHPRMPAKYRQTEPDLPFIRVLRQMLWDFIGELQEDVQKARELGPYLSREEVLEYCDEEVG